MPLLPPMGGQTALNLAVGAPGRRPATLLERSGVRLIGAQPAGDPERRKRAGGLFKEAVSASACGVSVRALASSLEEAERVGEEDRNRDPASSGGPSPLGGLRWRHRLQPRRISRPSCKSGLEASPMVSQILIERDSLNRLEEFELER